MCVLAMLEGLMQKTYGVNEERMADKDTRSFSLFDGENDSRAGGSWISLVRPSTKRSVDLQIAPSSGPSLSSKSVPDSLLSLKRADRISTFLPQTSTRCPSRHCSHRHSRAKPSHSPTPFDSP